MPLFVAVLVLYIVYISRERGRFLDDQNSKEDRGGSLSNCNLFSGQWVYDNKSYPLYKEQHCFFQFDGVACEKAGRKDLDYQNWRWQPRGCDLPRFNAIAMLESLRDKRLLFVGDSVIRNQWASMICLLESSIPPALRSVSTNGSLAIFHAKEYNASIEQYWAPFLVESSSDHPVFHHLSTEQKVRVREIEKHARYWTDADILIFNSYAWWRMPKLKVLWGSSDGTAGIYQEVDMVRAYEMALKTWLDWLDVHANRTRTKLYFVSMSQTHERGEKWGRTSGKNCYNEKEPISGEGYRGSSESDLEMARALGAAIDELGRRGLKVQLLNITELSGYRKDAHTSIYKKQWKRVTSEELANPSSYADCVNWCIPGVPDIWNELLYAYIFYFSQ
ncbi:protein trichome birefringence-like 34 [Diospyros lotus]|uniref:protein trichome birefringence-like 34 n=1 Tax=Diospyros lotus TaxID=55363 RepID=UPI002253DE8F|nr:protein trichome birefringence-like 34 [Diospyros lotus]